MQAGDAFLDRMRQEGDREADEVMERAFGSDARSFYSYLPLDRQKTEGHNVLPDVRRFLLDATPWPSDHDGGRFERGQHFFTRYALDIMTMLGAMSLPYCYAATPGNKAIHLTEKMRKNPGKRLLDTAHFIIEVMKPGAFAPGGNGHFEVRKTRLIHALVRYSIRTRMQWQDEWGLPVNQEDLAGTNLAFSYVALIGLDRSGFRIADKDKEDFLYTWKWVGYLLGIDLALLPETLPDAAALEQRIKQRHFRRSEEGVRLTRELIDHYKESFPWIAGKFIESQIHYFVGPEISQFLGLSPPPGQEWFVRRMNRFRENLNRHFVNPWAYAIMIRNHEKLKRKYV